VFFSIKSEYSKQIKKPLPIRARLFSSADLSLGVFAILRERRGELSF
jgi:hypothetical protein